MTKEENVYVVNEVIALLNEPWNRILVKMMGKQETVRKISKEFIEDNFPDVSEGDRADIIENVLQKAKSCAYPQEPLPFETVTLSYRMTLFLSDVSDHDFEKTIRTIATLTDAMEGYGDARYEKLDGALEVFKELLLSRGVQTVNNRASG